MAARRKVPVAPAPATAAPAPAPAPVEETAAPAPAPPVAPAPDIWDAVWLVRIALPGDREASVACRSEEEALGIVGFIAAARQEERMALLPAAAWLDAEPSARHILIDPVGATVRVSPPPADRYAVPRHVFEALAALPPLRPPQSPQERRGLRLPPLH